MYLLFNVLLLLVLPVVSIIIALAMHPVADIVMLIGTWFVFWAGGVRLFIAGIRQTAKPAFTASEIFELSDSGAHKIVRELGFANLSIGALNILTLLAPAWLVPAALVSGLFYAFAGIGHLRNSGRNGRQTTAMIGDLAIAVVLFGFVVVTLLDQRAAA
jgi:hypothetical protein